MKYLFILLSLWLVSCVNPSSPGNSKEKYLGDFTVKTIDSCQYIEYRYGTGTEIGLYSITHKGNCDNPIHLKH